MASSQRARHARRPERRLRPHPSPTALAVGGLAAVFTLASVLALHVMNVPSHLRQEGVAGPVTAPTRHSASTAHPRPSEARAARSAQRESPTPTPSTSSRHHLPATTKTAQPTAAPTTSSARPSPHPSPSPSSRPPLPLPTLSPRAGNGA